MKRFKYQFLLALVLILSLSSNVVAASANESKEDKKFIDVSKDKWYYDEISLALKYGIMQGTSADTFEPEAAATRAQVTQTLYNLAGRPEISYESTFSDVSSGAWYAKAIHWANKSQIVKGYEDGTFRPNDNIVRQDIVVLLYRYLGSPEITTDNLSTFPDAQEVSKYARKAVEWAISEEILLGDKDGGIRPQGTAIRAELATILVRYYEKYIHAEEQEYKIPILLYHHLSETEAESDTVLSPANFERQVKLLYENGYQTVSFEDLLQFVENGKKMPEKAVVITFDDGYYSNYEYAFPILQKYGFEATIFVIGHSIGQDMYKDTGYKITPHFGTQEMQEMLASGLIKIHSHTYDMHQWSAYESGDVIRENMLPLAGESEEEYTQALRQDVEKQDKIFAECGLNKSNVLAFPTGKYTSLTDEILISCGYDVTVTTNESKINTLVQGQSKTLIDLGRMNISGTTTDEQILKYCEMK